MIYRRLASPLHAARAGAGAAWCLSLAVAALALPHPLALGAAALAIVAGGIAAGVRRALWRTARLALPLALVVALVNPFVVRDGLTVFARLGEVPPFGQIDLTVEALAYGALLGARIAVVLLCFTVLSVAVNPDEILRGLRRVSLRSALSATLATRLVPVLARDARRLDDARRCRPDGGGRGPRARVAVMRAVAVGALDRALDVAATLETRGYAGARRPPRSRAPWSRHDLGFTAAAVAILALTLVGRAGGAVAFDPYPLLRVDVGPGVAVIAAALIVVALAPLADRRGIEP